ncbi:4-amino-4-deoxy-L-arabinose transferase [Bacillus clarus]|uniref:4-amino-4-deoxy-L-arabinose transferase n=1 Tax=Bacillus clarus TaxID=2338372 RepID=A0A090Z1Q3_9BACI|nr:glycosyltransferase family 39 protein [Bacillus clarus]KFN04552.1 dolichyl-phosphate-mannose-mannosyltransferase family protein [Bacillus clarus]RFT67382.1 4-amino-4-deoxy-L-arabinose transferase [Bacillus clarus]
MLGQFIRRYNWILLGIIIIVGFLLRFITLQTHGIDLSIASDDVGYQKSAKILLETGMLTYHDPAKPTIHIMPGFPALLAAVFYFFGSGSSGLFVAKLIIIIFGIASIYMTYKIGTYLLNPAAGLIAALLLAIYPPEIVIENVTLTEGPFLFFSLGLLYWSLKLADTHSTKDFLIVLAFYFLALYFRVQIALYPVLLFAYLVMKRYPFHIMVKQALISIGIALIVLGPWWARNYMQFNKFIPLTAGAGNPLLLGTYQGEGYPEGKDMGELEVELHAKYPDLEAHEFMELEEKIAIDKMKEWWKTDKESMIRSYLILKPEILWKKPYYSIEHNIEVFDVSAKDMNEIYDFIKQIFFICTVLSFVFLLSRWRETTFLWLILLFQTYLTCLYVAYERYALPLIPFLFIIIGIGIVVTVGKINKLLFQKRKF